MSRTSIDAYEWSTRARNVLNGLFINSIPDLASADAATLCGARGLGGTTLRELAHGCLVHGCFPQWIMEAAHNRVLEFHTESIPAGHVNPREFAYLAGPYPKIDRWMLEIAIAQLGPRIGWVVESDGQGTYSLWRSRRGYVEVGQED